MKQFYQSTYYFWIVTKFIFAIAALINAVTILGITDLTLTEKSANYTAVLYAVFLIFDLIFSLNGTYSKFLKYTTGTISIILGIIIFGIIIKFKVISVPITIVFFNLDYSTRIF